jgi:hypothetical protein
MIRTALHSSQPLAAVLAALRARAGEWRDSHLPPDLRRAGIVAVESQLSGATCTLTYERQWYGLGARGQLLRARATAQSDGQGTRVEVVVDHHWKDRDIALPAIGVGVATLMGFLAIGLPALVLLLLLLGMYALLYFTMRFMSRELTRANDVEADYLVRRIEAAVASASEESIAATVS